MSSRLNTFLRWETLLVFLLIVTFVIGAQQSSSFLTENNLSLAGGELVEKAIMALGLTMIIIAGEIDLSVASVLGLSSALLGAFVSDGIPLVPAMALVLVAGALAGLFNGFLVARVGLPSLVVTLGTLALFRGLAYVVLGETAVSSFPKTFLDFGFDNVGGTPIPWPALLFFALGIVVFLVLHCSWIGRRIFAIGNNEEAARFSGIDVRNLKMWLFVVSGLLAAVAGIVFTARFASARPNNGFGFELDVITAVLLGGVSIFGGRGNLIGVVLSLILIGAVRNVFNLNDVGADQQSIVIGSLLIASVIGNNALQRVRDRVARRAMDPAGEPSIQGGGG